MYIFYSLFCNRTFIYITVSIDYTIHGDIFNKKIFIEE